MENLKSKPNSHMLHFLASVCVVRLLLKFRAVDNYCPESAVLSYSSYRHLYIVIKGSKVTRLLLDTKELLVFARPVEDCNLLLF